MNRQYIGARYVPRFMGSYSGTTKYEVLDVVDDGLGTSYILKKPAPVGTPITNTDFWALYGSTSGAVLDLQNRMGTVEGEINTIENDVTGVKTRLSNLENTGKRKALYIGNSYTGGVGSSTGNNGIFNRTKHIFDDSAMRGGSGADFILYDDGTETRETFRNVLNRYINDSNKEIPLNEITDIIFITAIGNARAVKALNSSGTYRVNLIAELKLVYNTIKDNFPNIKKMCVYNADSRGTFRLTSGSITTINFHSYAADYALRVACNESGLEYKGWIGFDIMYSSNDFSGDLYHPNDNGYDKLSKAFISCYDNGVHINDIKFTNYTLDLSSFITGLTATLRIIETPEETQLFIENVNTSGVPSSYNLPPESYVNVLDFNTLNSVEGFMPFINPGLVIVNGEMSLNERDMKKNCYLRVKLEDTNGIGKLALYTLTAGILTGNKSNDGITGSAEMPIYRSTISHRMYL